MRVILNFNVPPVRCFLHHAFPLGVFWDENDPEIMKWFCLNYNYMFGNKELDDVFFTYLVNYNNVPFLQKRMIYGDEFEKYLSMHDLSEMGNF